MPSETETILVLDLGSQYTQLIARRVREQNVFSVIHPYNLHFKKILDLNREKIKLVDTKPKKWDRRYRMVMFDIPERRNRIRKLLRFEMQEVGFLRIQDSVWVYPFDCEEFISLLKADLRIGKDVLYAVVEEIENDKWIRQHFNLPLD